ncbi:MAG: hypothetical protein HY900_02945, partial [Deltaproteobacteria bacterium]|nr:hypothetical protein [Deltaproteobacteria bacterium]
QILLNVGGDLAAKIDSVARRQAGRPEVRLGPVVLEGSEAVASRYCRKIHDFLDPLLERAGPQVNPFVQRVYRSLGPEGTETANNVRDMLQKALSNAAGLGHLLRAIRDEQSAKLWERSVAAAYISAALGSVWCREAKGRPRDATVRQLAGAGLLQDLSILLRPSLYRSDLTRHPVRSAPLAGEMGFSATLQELVEDHHRLLVPDGETDGQETERPVSEAASLLVVTNMFVASLWAGSHRERDIEGIKALNFLMSEGKLPREPVGILTRMYFSKKFSLFVEKATDIMALCPQVAAAKPILWNILGERNPHKFICQLKTCPHIGSQVTMIAQAIGVRLEEKVVGQIEQGEYSNCTYLSTELEKLYREIASVSTR